MELSIDSSSEHSETNTSLLALGDVPPENAQDADDLSNTRTANLAESLANAVLEHEEADAESIHSSISSMESHTKPEREANQNGQKLAGWGI